VRKSDLVVGTPYYAAWQEYTRTWRRSVLLFLALWVGGGSATLIAIQALFPVGPSWLGLVCIVPWGVAAVFVSQAPIRWRCPRCGEPFHSTTWAYNGFARRCMHCHLPKWAPAG
jgi:hypothetical protein